MNGSIECAAILTISSEVKARTSQAGKRWLSFLGRIGHGDDVQWTQVACFGETAAALENKLAKGTKVYVEGVIKLNSWQSRQGASKSGLSIAARRCDVVGQIGRQRPHKGQTATTSAPASGLNASERFHCPFDDEMPV